jgi:hypothetical protein
MCSAPVFPEKEDCLTGSLAEADGGRFFKRFSGFSGLDSING